MGFFKSQKKMVACSYSLFPAADWNNADFGGRIGSGTFYLYIILIFPRRKKRYNAKSREITCPEKDYKLSDQYTATDHFSLYCDYYIGNDPAVVKESRY